MQVVVVKVEEPSAAEIGRLRGGTPLLVPMSRIAGRMAAQAGASAAPGVAVLPGGAA
jgi:alanine dehydrogenase